MTHLLVLRPEPGATATARRIRERGWRATVAPLFAIRPVAWTPSDEPVDAVMLTSANAARYAGAAAGRYHALPCHAVGDATAEAARGVGFVDVRRSANDAAALAEQLAHAGRVLHLAGREHKDPLPAGGLRRIVYAADAVTALPAPVAAALDEGAVALLHSARAAATLAVLLDRSRSAVSIAAFSPDVADAAGSGWRSLAVATVPDDAALLAAAAGLCDHRRD